MFAHIDRIPRNGSAVPGNSPVRYHDDPGNDIFQISSLDMYPNPCVMYVFYFISALHISVECLKYGNGA